MARGRNSGKATITDVAAVAGVSVAAVSKVVNGKGGISEPTRQRVLEAAAKLQWSPSAAAVALRGARTRTLGMVVGRTADLLTADPHFAVFISGIESQLSPLGYGLLLHIVGEEPEAELRAYRRLAEERRVDGVILTESRIGDTRFDLMRRLRLPALLVGTPWQDDPIPQVQAAGQDTGLREAVDHLVELGHRRIAYVSGPEDRVHTTFRRQVIESRLAGHGLRPSHVVVADFTAQDAADAVGNLVEPSAQRPSAIVFGNDTMAVAGVSAARRLGLEVPRDLSVIGYDDLPLGEIVHPRLTTVNQDVEQLGRAGAAGLLALLGEAGVSDVAPPRPPRLVVRESTGPAPRG